MVVALRHTVSWSVHIVRGTANARARLSEKHPKITSVNKHVMATNKSVLQKDSFNTCRSSTLKSARRRLQNKALSLLTRPSTFKSTRPKKERKTSP